MDQDWIRIGLDLDQICLWNCHCDVWFWLTVYRSRWGNFVDVVASVSGHDRFPVLALMGRQVLLSHNAAPLLDGRYNGFCYPALVEACMQ